MNVRAKRTSESTERAKLGTKLPLWFSIYYFGALRIESSKQCRTHPYMMIRASPGPLGFGHLGSTYPSFAIFAELSEKVELG